MIKNGHDKTKRKVLKHSSHYFGGLNTLAPEQPENNFIDITNCRTENCNQASVSVISGQVHFVAVRYITMGVIVLLSSQHVVRDEKQRSGR